NRPFEKCPSTCNIWTASIDPSRFCHRYCEQSEVPIVSTATSPALSPNKSPYFIRTAQCSSFQVKAIAAIVKAFNWREVVLVYEDSTFGSGTIPYLTDALIEVNARGVCGAYVTLYYLALFSKGERSWNISKGYAWIITDVLASLLDSTDSTFINSMQGVLGVKPNIPRSDELNNFTRRWKRRFRQENPDMDEIELDVYGIWAYDSVTALAMAIERTSSAPLRFKQQPATRENTTDLAAIGTSEWGPKLVESIRNIRFKGLSGDFHIVDGQLQPSAYEIVNVMGNYGGRRIGFWTEKHGISDQAKTNGRVVYTANADDLKAIIWPGEISVVPKGWEMPTSGKKLKSMKTGEAVDEDCLLPEQSAVGGSRWKAWYGFWQFASEAVSVEAKVREKFVPFESPGSEYNELVYQIFREKFDAVVGDVTILANRSKYVDFTLPFTESGVVMIVPIKYDERKNAWIFMKPLTADLWLTTGAFFVFIGAVVWVLEHRVNKEFRGPPSKQVGMILWFSFSTLVFAHKYSEMISRTRRREVNKQLIKICGDRLGVRGAVQKLQPTITDINDLIRNGEYVGYQIGSFVEELLNGSFVEELLVKKKLDKSKFRAYGTLEEYDDALTKGSRNGGVAAIVDELPYIRLFFAKYCRKYTIVGPTYKTAGFGFAFPMGSPLVPEVSRAILNVTEGDKMTRFTQKWLGDKADCPEQDGAVVTSDCLKLQSFMGLFLIAGISSSLALIIFLLIFLHENRDVLASHDSVWQKLVAMAKIFDEEKENSRNVSKKMTTEPNDHELATTANAVPEDIIAAGSPQSPAISISHYGDGDGIFSQDEGFSTTEPGTPIHDSIAITETIRER
ncbi:unnamed protein product, partial [Ilex paraguariensis]